MLVDILYSPEGNRPSYLRKNRLSLGRMPMLGRIPKINYISEVMEELQIREKELLKTRYRGYILDKLLHVRWSIPFNKKKDCIV